MIHEAPLQQLREAAIAASQKAYCPYSRFAVGAALLTDDGRIFAGCNVENASYGLTICAERNAVFHAVAAAVRRIVALVVFTPTSMPTTPCGACRQVLNEFGPDAEVVTFCNGPGSQRFRVSELLPAAFGPENLAERGDGK